jgi:hypothetical protein
MTKSARLASYMKPVSTAQSLEAARSEDGHSCRIFYSQPFICPPREQVDVRSPVIGSTSNGHWHQLTSANHDLRPIGVVRTSSEAGSHQKANQSGLDQSQVKPHSLLY